MRQPAAAKIDIVREPKQAALQQKAKRGELINE
jgi:hypothetical protein